MELSSSGPPERLNNLNKVDSSPHREKDENVNIKLTEVGDIQEQMVQRCVIIQKDEKGYGLTVSGDNPVFVQSVKEDGAAARAGVQQGDRIIKVNGTLVTQSNHQDVVELIKSGSYVALTLLGKPPGHGRSLSCTLQPLNISGSNAGSHSTAGKLSSPSERITGPQPVDPEKQQQLTNSRILTIRKMLEKEVTYLENLRVEYSKSPSEKIHAELNGAAKRVKTLEEQLCILTGVSADQIIPKSPKSPPAPHVHRHYHSEKENRHSMTPTGHLARSLIHQVSAPALPPKPDHLVSYAKASTQSTDLNSPPDAGSQRNNVDQGGFSKPSLSSSLESIEKQMTCRTTTWPQVGAAHTRQSSSPDHLMKHVESLRHHRNAKTASDLFRSHSEASQHFHKSPVSDSVPGVEAKSAQHPISRDSSLGQHESTTESPVPSPPHSPPEYAEIQGDKVEASEDDIVHEEYGTPPETNAVEVNMHSVITKLGQAPSIICMEDDDFSSDTELSHLEDHGPFNGLWKLVRNPVHLAVFMHYLMSNSNSSSLFFYLISDLYEQGTAKDMKKWAYEIHSSFLVPGAPLKVATVDEGILHEIDDVLLHQIDKEETLRTVFKKARKKAREEINDLLADFRNKRTMGLANIFSPPDYQLEEAMHDKNKETKMIEQLLLPHLETVPDDLESMNDTMAARTFALVTILKQFGVKSPQDGSPQSVALRKLLEQCPTFVSKEKSRLRFLQRKEKVVFVQDHHFLPEHYYSVTYCNHCQLIIWGVGNQGYQCQICQMNIHKTCVKVVEEHCIGALRNKKDKRKDTDKRKDRVSGIVENFIGKSRKPSQPVPAAIEKARKLNEEMNMDNDGTSMNDSVVHENSHDAAEKTDSRPDSKITNDSPQAVHVQNKALDKAHFNKKNAAGIGRSESFRQRRESRPSFRKRSDPNIPRSKSDVEVDDKSGASNLNNSGSSSNSSLSNRSLDSPSTSSDMVHRTPTATLSDNVPQVSVATSNVPSPLAGTPSNTANSYDDSDLEAEVDPPRWQDSVDREVLRLMKPKEKKRQDVINELFHTEKNHVRNLKVLDRIFYKPLLQEQLLPPDFLHLLFPNLEEMIEIHSSFNNKMKAQRKEEPVIGNIGPMLLEMFDGPAGEHLKKAAATYCQNHSIALESLKNRQKKDQKLAQFLSDAELHNLCRRLQLKDIIASGFQRLTKYPLLLENIAKYTAPNTQELSDLQRAVECSKDILVFVDSAVKEAENLHRLSDIQKKLEKSAFEKVDHPIVHSFKNLDVTKHKLIHEGPLTWRLNKQKAVDMHVVLLEDVLVLLQKQDDKYILKFHNTNLTTGREDTKIMHSPILRVQNLLIRNNATDKRSIFLISSSELHAIYEFVAATTAEQKIWCRYLTEAVEVNKGHSGPVKQPELPHVVTDHVVPPDENQADETVSCAKEPQSKEEVKEKKLSTDSMDSVSSTLTSSGSSSANSTEAADSVIANESALSDAAQSLQNTADGTSSSESQDKTQKRLQRVEILKIADGPQLIEPCEVIVSQGAVLQTAEPVLTPIEKLRRKDQEITVAIQEKRRLVGDIIQIPPEELVPLAEPTEDVEGKNAQELIVAAVHQADQVSLLLSECLNATAEESSLVHGTEVESVEFADTVSTDSSSYHAASAFRRIPKVPLVSADKLLASTASLNRKLAQLLAVITESEDERRQLRNELISTREQIHLMHETHRHCTLRSRSPSNVSASQSRPNSFVSIASSMSEDTPEICEEQQQLPSVLHKVIEETSSPDTSVAEPANVLSEAENSEPACVHAELPADDSGAPDVTDGEVCLQPDEAAPSDSAQCDLPVQQTEVSDSDLGGAVQPESEATEAESENRCGDDASANDSSNSACKNENVGNPVDPIYF